MAWQGIPFRVPFGTNDFISIALNSIPKILLESPTDYNGLLLTAGAALAGGIIPAIIAWLTFRQNIKNIKTERELQQTFLIQERERQQEFLVDERREQNASLEADRAIQLSIAEKNFNMQVLSVNRQAWINDVRELISECCVLCTKMFDEQSVVNHKRKQYEKFVDEYYTPIDLAYQDLFTQHADGLRSAREDYNKTRERVDFLYSKIQLMLNPSEDESSSIVRVLFRLRCRGGELSEEGNTYSTVYGNLRNDINELITLTHVCLKKEWIRVKNGN